MRDHSSEGVFGDVGRVPARPRAPYFGSPRFVWASIAALGLIGRARRDPAVLRTAAKLAIAVMAAQGLARMRPDRVSERSAAAWAAAGVLEREQGKGPGLAAYGGAALTGVPRTSDGRHPVAAAVIGAVLGRLVGRLVGQLRFS
jgi:hypothetical protein